MGKISVNSDIMRKMKMFVCELRTDESEKGFVGFSFVIKRRKFELKMRVGFWKVISNSDE